MKNSISFILTVLLALSGIIGCNSRTKSDHSDRPQEVREVGFDDSTDSAYNDTVINSFANSIEKQTQAIGKAGYMETPRIPYKRMPATQNESENSVSLAKGTTEAEPLPKGTTDADYVQWVIDMIEFYQINMMKGLNNPNIQVGVSPIHDIMNTMEAANALQNGSNRLVKFAQLLNQLDVSKCPEDFQSLYKEYARKYLVVANAIHQMINGDMGLLDLVVLGLQAEYTKDLDKVEETMFTLAKNKYGAKIPKRE